jgi:hypothetical protein
MSDVLKDGTGKGNTAKVDSNNRLHVGAVSREEERYALAKGDFFITSSGVVTLTDDAETTVWYIKNNSDRDLYLGTYIISGGPSTGGSGPGKTKTYSAPSATSPIITEAKAGVEGNANLASSKQFNGLVYRGETGDNLVGGIGFNTIFHPNDVFNFQTNVDSVLPKGTDGVFTFTAPTGNTSQEIIMTVLCYYLDEELPS